MQSFTYYTPTKVVFGKNTESEVGTLLKEAGATKVLVHFGGQSAQKSGLLDRIYTTLDQEGLHYVCIGGVQPNPRLSLVNEGIALARRENVDFILAVGGGSVIDSAKAIGYGIANHVEGDALWQYYEKKQTPKGCLPIGCVLTIAAAGSEMSDSSVITNEDGWLKKGCSHVSSRPRFAILNPELTMSLPWFQTACGIADILMHTMERYFSSTSMDLTTHLSETLIKTVMTAATILKEDPNNYEARAEIMWAGSLAHNGLLTAGTDGGDWATHQLEHELSGKFDVAHGAGLAAVWASWARHVMPENKGRFAQFANGVFGFSYDGDIELTAMRGIDAMEDFFFQLDLPVSLLALVCRDVTDEEIADMADKCCWHGGRTIGAIKKIGREEMVAIYKAARE